LILRLQPEGSFNSLSSSAPTGRRLQPPSLSRPTALKYKCRPNCHHHNHCHYHYHYQLVTSTCDYHCHINMSLSLSHQPVTTTITSTCNNHCHINLSLSPSPSLSLSLSLPPSLSLSLSPSLSLSLPPSPIYHHQPDPVIYNHQPDPITWIQNNHQTMYITHQPCTPTCTIPCTSTCTIPCTSTISLMICLNHASHHAPNMCLQHLPIPQQDTKGITITSSTCNRDVSQTVCLKHVPIYPRYAPTMYLKKYTSTNMYHHPRCDSRHIPKITKTCLKHVPQYHQDATS
jgi:hypothetical protein